MGKCHICGGLKKILIPCSRCDKNICLNDFYIKDGLCADCMTLVYNEKYADKIEAYAKG